MNLSVSITERNEGWLWARDGRLRLAWWILLGFMVVAGALVVARVVLFLLLPAIEVIWLLVAGSDQQSLSLGNIDFGLLVPFGIIL